MVAATEQAFLVTGSIAGRSMTFDGISSGGGITAAVTKFRPGGLGAEQALPAMGSYDDITVTKHYDVSAVQENLRYFLGLAVAGTATMHVAVQPLNVSTQTPVGNPITYTGLLTTVDPGTVDSESGSTRMLSFTMSVEAAA